MTRREFIVKAGASAAALAVASASFAADKPSARANVLLITADDMNYESLGITGSKTPGVSSNIDALAKSGMLFQHAHVNSAICQPSRSVIMTGRYPHRSGALGFDPIREDVPTLGESLRAAGYLNGIIDKVGHLAPESKFCWDFVVGSKETDHGRGPKLYYNHTKRFLDQAKAAGKPFFLIANSQDPHRPFPEETDTSISRRYKPEEVEVPGFLPDLPNVRREVASYYTAVHRCDETVGQILKALKDSGQEDNTLVIFLSDNGMSFPYAKTNCYEVSTRTPLILRWPSHIKPGKVDSDDMVSCLDLMPTILEALDVKPPTGMDGRSFLPLLEGKPQDGRDKVFTFITRNSSRTEEPIRSVRTKHSSYIYNAWSDGKMTFRNESQGGLTFPAMKKAGETDPKIAQRVNFFLHRVPEEFYDLDADPWELRNLIDSPEHKSQIGKLRSEMLAMMESTSDPLLEGFRRRIGRG